MIEDVHESTLVLGSLDSRGWNVNCLLRVYCSHCKDAALFVWRSVIADEGAVPLTIL